MKEHIVAKYIKLYFNNTITKCVADAIQISKLFLGVTSKHSFNEAFAMKEYIREYIIVDGEKHKPRQTILLASPFKLLLKDPEHMLLINKFYVDEPVAYAFLSDEKLTDRFKEDKR